MTFLKFKYFDDLVAEVPSKPTIKSCGTTSVSVWVDVLDGGGQVAWEPQLWNSDGTPVRFSRRSERDHNMTTSNSVIQDYIGSTSGSADAEAWRKESRQHGYYYYYHYYYCCYSVWKHLVFQGCEHREKHGPARFSWSQVWVQARSRSVRSLHVLCRFFVAPWRQGGNPLEPEAFGCQRWLILHFVLFDWSTIV